MIWVDKSCEEWRREHAGLKVAKVKCSECSAELETNRPFLEKGFAGLAVERCPCGRNRNMADVRITTTEESYRKWKGIMDAQYLAASETEGTQ